MYLLTSTRDALSTFSIFSTSFSASGEFYERPLAGDFAVTIGGAPGDGVVVVGFDNVISRSKPVTITRDFDSPHRLGLFGITGGVNVVSKQLADLFNKMTIDEKLLILGMDFDQMWFRIWLKKEQDLIFIKSKHKFESIFAVDKGDKLKRIISKSKNIIIPWEIQDRIL